MQTLGKARQRSQKFLPKHDRIYPVQQIVIPDYVDAVTDAHRRVQRLTRQITALFPIWSVAPGIKGRQMMRSLALIVAVTGVAGSEICKCSIIRVS